MNEELKSEFEVETDNRIPLAAGQIHQKIVKRISITYRNSEEDDKQRMLRAISDMADSRALNPGDSIHIEETIEIAYRPLSDETDSFSDQLIETLTALNKVHSNVKNNPTCSPATKTIIEITQQSSIEAAEKIRLSKEPNNGKKKKLWKNLVLEDLDGGLQGGAAVVTISPAFNLSLPLATALGMLVGAGIRSGIAYGKINNLINETER